jgi:hypothetical protein
MPTGSLRWLFGISIILVAWGLMTKDKVGVIPFAIGAGGLLSTTVIAVMMRAKKQDGTANADQASKNQ